MFTIRSLLAAAAVSGIAAAGDCSGDFTAGTDNEAACQNIGGCTYSGDTNNPHANDTCTATLCAVDQYVASNACTDCPAVKTGGTALTATEDADASAADTHCAGKCADLEIGATAADNEANCGAIKENGTVCTYTAHANDPSQDECAALCAVNQYVASNTCKDCPAVKTGGTALTATKDADASAADTHCAGKCADLEIGATAADNEANCGAIKENGTVCTYTAHANDASQDECAAADSAATDAAGALPAVLALAAGALAALAL